MYERVFFLKKRSIISTVSFKKESMGTNFTKQLLIASRGHQAPRKATHCLRRKVGQNIKDKKGDKRARDRDPSRGGGLNREVSSHQETLTLAGLREVFKSRRAT